MPSFDNLPDDKKLHQMIIMKIWKDIAPDIYRAYLEIGRGVVAMFMMDTMPEMLKGMLPEGEGVISGTIDEQVHRYDPTTSIVFAFFNKKVKNDGTRGVSSCGYEITPSAEESPLELYKKKDSISVRRIDPKKGNDHPLINLN